MIVRAAKRYRRSGVDRSFSTIGSRGASMGPRAPPKRYTTRAKPSAGARGQAFERQDTVSMDSRFLYSAEVTFPVTNDVTNINAHPDLVHLSGLKACYMFENRQDKPFEVHFAIVQGKASQLSGQQDLETEFFRNNTDNTRATDDFTQDNSEWNQRYLCAPINSDKWNIITHTKRILWPKGSDTATGTGTYFWKHEKYYPIKRNIRFDRTFRSVNTEPFVICVWCVELHKEDAPFVGDPPIYVPYSSAIDLHTATTAYWRNSLYDNLGLYYKH